MTLKPLIPATPEYNHRRAMRELAQNLPKCKICNKKKLTKEPRKTIGICAPCLKKEKL